MDLDRIEQLRASLGLSQQEAAVRSGFKGRTNWNNIVKGRHDITVPQLEAIASTLGVEPAALLSPPRKPGRPKRGG